MCDVRFPVIQCPQTFSNTPCFFSVEKMMMWWDYPFFAVLFLRVCDFILWSWSSYICDHTTHTHIWFALFWNHVLIRKPVIEWFISRMTHLTKYLLKLEHFLFLANVVCALVNKNESESEVQIYIAAISKCFLLNIYLIIYLVNKFLNLIYCSL